MNVLEFYDNASHRYMGLTIIGQTAWLVYKHSDGQWVTDRSATDEDMGRILERMRYLSEDGEVPVW